MKPFFFFLRVLVALFFATLTARSQPNSGPFPVGGGGGGSGGATNGIQQLNGNGTNTTLTNATIYGTFTGNGGGLTNVNATNGFLNLGPVGGLAPLGNVIATYPLQAAISSYGDNIPYIWFAHNAGVGTNAWGIPVNFPGGISQEGQLWITNKFVYSGNVQKNIYMNGGPTGSALTNGYPSGTNGAAADSYVRIHNINPFATGASLGLMSYTTNVTNFTGSTYSTIVGTNVDGVVIRQMDPFGEAFVWTPDTCLVGEKDQAGVMTWLAGIGAWDQAIGGNYQIGAETAPSQHSTFYAFNSGPYRTDGRGTSGQWHVGMPLQVANVQMPTNVNWKWALDVDELNGTVAVTNGLTTLTNLIVLKTNAAVIIGGGPAGNSGVLNVGGNAVFNLVPNPGAFNNGALVTFAYQNTSYLGIGGYGSGVKANPGVVTLNGREIPFYWSDGGGGDLQTRLTLQTWTKLGGFDANGDWGITNNERIHGTATFDGNTKFSGNGGSTLGYYPTATDSSGNWTWQALSANVALLNATQTFTGSNRFTGGMGGNANGLTNLSANADSYGLQTFTATTNLTIDFTTNGLRKIYLTLAANACFSNFVAAPGGSVAYFLTATATRNVYLPWAQATAGGISNIYNTNWISSVSGSNAVFVLTNGQQGIFYFDMSTNAAWSGVSCIPALR